MNRFDDRIKHISRSLRAHSQKLLAISVLSVTGLASAGSYDDFFTAIVRDEPAAIRSLLARGFDANTLDPKGQLGLISALQNQEPSLKAAEVLADWPKTNVNLLNSKGESPLMLASLKGYMPIAKKLVARGADINKTGWTPLHYAASGGQAAMVAFLLDNSAYIDAESPNGSTPLMMAAMYGTTDTVKLLLREGADTSLKNQQGLTALQFAQRGNRPDAAEAIAQAIRAKRPPGQW